MGALELYMGRAQPERLVDDEVGDERSDPGCSSARYMQIEGMAELTLPPITADPAKLPPMAA